MSKINISIILLLCCFAICTNTMAQNDPKVFFAEDSTRFSFKMLKEDPNVNFNWQLTGGGTFILSERYFNLGLKVNGKYQVTPLIELRGDVNAAFQLGDLTLDASFDDFTKPVSGSLIQNHSAEVGFTIFKTIENRDSRVVLKEKEEYRKSTIYYLRWNTNYRKSISFIAGVNKTIRRMGKKDPTTFTASDGFDTIDGRAAKYRPALMNTTNLKIGVEWRTSTTGKMRVNGKLKPNYSDSRLFVMLLIPVNNLIDVSRSLKPESFGDLYDYELVNEGFIQSEIRPFGFILGLDALAARSSHTMFAFRMELGILPGFKDDSFFKSYYAGVGMTFGIGSDLFKQLDRS